VHQEHNGGLAISYSAHQITISSLMALIVTLNR
jgi:hypothetical protein